MGIITNWLNAMGGRKANKTNLQIARETNQTNLQLAREQNQWNLEQWNRQNEYNTPLNQVNLLKEAGLNPNLYKGEGSTAGSLVSADLANQQAVSVQNPFGGISDMNLAQGYADFKRTLAETEGIKAETGLNKTKNVNEMKQGEFIEALNKSQLELNNSTVSVNYSVKNMNELQSEVFKKRVVEMDQHIQEMQSNIAKNCAGVKLTYANISKIDQELQMQWKRLNLDAEQLKAQKALWRATESQLFSQMRLNNKHGESLDLANALNACTFTYDVEGKRVSVSSANEGLRHVKVMNGIDEDFSPYEKGFGILNQTIGSIASGLIGFGAVKKGISAGTAAGISLLNPSTSISRP